MPQLKRSDSLAFFFREGEFCCRNFLTDRQVAASPELVAVLARVGAWSTPAQLRRLFADYSPASVRSTVADLAARSLLVRRGSTEARREAALAAWANWGIEAQLFHFGTKRTHRQNAVKDEAAFSRKRLRESPEPPQIKRYPGAARHTLPNPGARLSGEFAAVAFGRRTHRSFGTGRISSEDLSALLSLTWRITGQRPWSGLPPRPLKTSPSGGARHSLEVYVFCRRAEGIPAGVYHYRPDVHQLERVRPGAGVSRWARFCGHQKWVCQASALFVMTTVISRVMWRYRFARAYRTLLLEAGHFGQTFCLAATKLGLAPFCTAALDDEAIEEYLGLDGANETVLYTLGVGPMAAS